MSFRQATQNIFSDSPFGSDQPWQAHHVIPNNLSEAHAWLDDIGFDIQDASVNGIPLPSNNTVSLGLGVAVHRGSHPSYDDVVSEALTFIKQQGLTDTAALQKVNLLVDELKLGLAPGLDLQSNNFDLAHSGQPKVLLNLSDPRASGFADQFDLSAATRSNLADGLASKGIAINTAAPKAIIYDGPSGKTINFDAELSTKAGAGLDLSNTHGLIGKTANVITAAALVEIASDAIVQRGLSKPNVTEIKGYLQNSNVNVAELLTSDFAQSAGLELLLGTLKKAIGGPFAILYTGWELYENFGALDGALSLASIAWPENSTLAWTVGKIAQAKDLLGYERALPDQNQHEFVSTVNATSIQQIFDESKPAELSGATEIDAEAVLASVAIPTYEPEPTIFAGSAVELTGGPVVGYVNAYDFVDYRILQTLDEVTFVTVSGDTNTEIAVYSAQGDLIGKSVGIGNDEILAITADFGVDVVLRLYAENGIAGNFTINTTTVPYTGTVSFIPTGTSETEPNGDPIEDPNKPVGGVEYVGTSDQDDDISSGNGKDVVYLLDGDDELSLGGGDDLAYGGDGDDEIDGGSGDDWIAGEGDEDTIDGGNGDDAIYGGDKDDSLDGENGDDLLAGEDDDDTIRGGDGYDTIYGGDDEDKIYGEDDHDELYGERGRDTIYGGHGRDTVFGGKHDDSIRGGDHDDKLLGEDGEDFIDGDYGDDTIFGGDGDDKIEGGNDDDWIAGEDDNDTIDGQSGDDEIYGGLNDDWIDGGSGDDLLVGESGADRIDGESGVDSLYGDSGNDTLYGGSSGDLLVGGTGDDILAGESGADTLVGDSGDDVLDPGSGSNEIYGGSGVDTLRLSDIQSEYEFKIVDTDLYAFRLATSNDWSKSSVFAGIEFVEYSDGFSSTLSEVFLDQAQRESQNSTAAVTTTIAADLVIIDPFVTHHSVDFGAAELFAEFTYGNVGGETSVAASYSMYLSIDATLDSLDPLLLSNSIIPILGEGETHTVRFPVPIDIDQYALGNYNLIVEIEGSQSGVAGKIVVETLTIGPQTQPLTFTHKDGDGTPPDPAQSWQWWDERFSGTAGDDVIDGGAGDDDFLSTSGDDHYFGGSGANQYTIDDTTVAVSDITWSYDAGNDVLRGVHASFGTDYFDAYLGGFWSAKLSSNSETWLSRQDVISLASSSFEYNFEAPVAPPGPTAGDDSLSGTSGDDVVNLLAGNDQFTALEGDDDVVGAGGTDSIDGGPGDDTLNGGSGDDTLVGGSDDDLIIGSSGGDVINGGTNSANGDTASYSNSNGAVNINLLTNWASGADAHGDVLTNIENLFGSNFDDSLTGDGGDNIINGFGGDDTILGLSGNNLLEGGLGDDTFISHLGIDTINGGGGRDTADYSGSNAAVNIGTNNGAINSGGHAEGDVISPITENLTGSAYADTITGNTLANFLIGGGGNDTINASSGNDTIFGDDGDDLLLGSRGSDIIYGGAGNDTASYSNTDNTVIVNLAGLAFGSGHGGSGDRLYEIENVIGGQFNDTLIGTNEDNALTGLAGDDDLRGSVGDDTLIGNNGADTLNGGTGDDELIGGGGIDNFVFDIANFGSDTISGYVNGLELLDFRGSGLSFVDLTISTGPTDTIVSVTSDPTNQITLLNVTTVIDVNDFTF